MFKRLKAKLPRMPRPNSLVLLTAFLSFAVVGLGIWAYLQRVYGLNLLNREINKIQASLLEAGWDMAYDKAESSAFPLFAPLTFQNFRLYALDGSKEWKTEELKIGAGLFNCGHITPKASRKQTLTLNGKVYPAEIPVLDIDLYFDRALGLKEASIEGMGWNIRGLGTVDSLRLAAQRMAPLNISELTPFFENHLEVAGIQISEDVDFPLRKRINRIYANANIIGMITSKPTYTESLSAWLRLGGVFDIRKLIVEWAPLTMVARGDLYFNEKLEPNLHLNTSSKGLNETLDMLQDNFLERKGVFVAKILLNNKAFKLNKDDRYYTVTTPVNVNANQILIENIPLKKF